MTGFHSKEAQLSDAQFEEVRREMLASATYWAKDYIKSQKSEHWQDILQNSILEDWKTASLILGHLMSGSYALAHEMLRQHLFSEKSVELELQRHASIEAENRSDDERARKCEAL